MPHHEDVWWGGDTAPQFLNYMPHHENYGERERSPPFLTSAFTYI
jgi:hypothetical protein